jgi:hypothetical protein
MKKITMILPAIAILFAVAAALVTNASPSKSLVNRYVSDETTFCEQIGRCELGGETACKGPAGVQLYETITSCPAFNLNGVYFVEPIE